MPNLDYYNTARMHQMVNSFQNIYVIDAGEVRERRSCSFFSLVNATCSSASANANANANRGIVIVINQHGIRDSVRL